MILNGWSKIFYMAVIFSVCWLFPMASFSAGSNVDNNGIGGKVTVNFRDADIRAVIENVAEITGRSFILDPRVQGKVTIISPEALDADMLFEVILSALQVHGFQAVEDGPVTRVVPFTQSFQLAGGSAGNTITTAILKTHYIKAVELVPTIKPMINKGALLQAHASNNSLIVTDTRSQVERIRKLVEELDSPNQAKVEIIDLQYVSASEVLSITTQLNLFKEQNLSVLEDAFNNRLVVSGDNNARRDLRQMIAILDVPVSNKGGNVEVIRLNYLQAESLKVMLESMLSSPTLSQKISKEGEDQVTYRIEADLDNNALVVSASRDVIAEIKQVVRKLDAPRRQVLIEAIVAEISEEQAKNLTTQLALAGREGGAIINFNDLLPALAGIAVSDTVEPDTLSSLPLNRGILAGGASWDDDSKRGVGLLIEALKNDANTNILSTPSIVTLNNQEATISVGQEVPFITGSYVSSNNSVSNPFQTIEREEIGIKLTVKPQINDDDLVRLSIEQETSNLLSSAALAGTADVITAKRLISTNVMVGNGEFLVLGGLIDDSFSSSESKVPLLGDIPILGHLFRSSSKDNNQSVLMVFIRPTIMDSLTDRRGATEQRYRLLRDRQLRFSENMNGEGLKPLPESIDGLQQNSSENIKLSEEPSPSFNAPKSLKQP